MNASAPAVAPVMLDPVYALRDEIAQSRPPVNGFERVLVLAAAQAWIRHLASPYTRRNRELQNEPNSPTAALRITSPTPPR